jgi:hypothetical protein
LKLYVVSKLYSSNHRGSFEVVLVTNDIVEATYKERELDRGGDGIYLGVIDVVEPEAIDIKIGEYS